MIICPVNGINFETYLARLKAVRSELKLLEHMCMAGQVGEPLGNGQNGLGTADDALAVYKSLALITNTAVADCGELVPVVDPLSQNNG